MKMLQLTLALLRYSLLIGLLLSQSAAAEPLDSSLQQLGLLLGLPVDHQQHSPEQQDVPAYVQDIYECWSSNSAEDCLPGYHGSDVNLLRTSLGTELQDAPPALLSYNTERELKNTLQISFNVSVTLGRRDITHYAMLRVHRRALEQDTLAALDCSNLSDTSLQLYTQTGNEGGSPVFTFRAKQSLSEANFTSEDWIEFADLTELYRELIDSLHKRPIKSVRVTDVLNVRLAIASPSCPSLSPSDLGFESTSENGALLLGFEENFLQKDNLFSQVMSRIAMSHSRSKRQATLEGTVLELHTETPDNDTELTQNTVPMGAPLPEHVDEYPLSRCQLYHYEVSFKSLGITSVVTPSSYRANFCAGHCQWPPSMTQRYNRHAYIQAFTSFHNPDLIPEPSCVPHPGGLQKVMAVVAVDKQVLLKNYVEMAATSCDCL